MTNPVYDDMNFYLNSDEVASNDTPTLQRVEVWVKSTLSDLKSIATVYEFQTGADGGVSIWPFMTPDLVAGATFTPATTGVFVQGVAVPTTLESAVTMPNRIVTARVKFRLPNFTDSSVGNNNQGFPLACLVVNGSVVQIEGSVWSKSNVTSEFIYTFAPNDVVQVSLLSGNVDGSDVLILSDGINETDADFSLPDSAVNISWLSVSEVA